MTTSIDKTVKIEGNVVIGYYSTIEDYVELSAGHHNGRIIIGARSKIKRFVTIRSYDGQVLIGDRVSIGEYCVIFGHGGVIIGDYTILAPGVKVHASMHIYDEEYNIPTRFQGEFAQGIVIHKNVWVGANAVILDGIEICEGAVIGAGAVVNKNVPAHSVIAGVPARIIKFRKEMNRNEQLL